MAGLLHRFRQHVTLTPNSIAVQDSSITLTFQQLEQWSNRLAYEISSRTLNTSGIVAICIPRSAVLLVCVLAVVKAGFAYAPLDPSAPLSRIDDQVTQCDAPLLLVASGLTDNQLGDVFMRPLTLDVTPFLDSIRTNGPDPSPLQKVVMEVDTNDLLAVIFTSGSTGKPKGVLIEHASMINLIDGPTLEIRPGDRVALTANPSFDAASFEIWNSLTHGATIFILTAHLADTEAVAAFFHEKLIQKAFIPTAVFHRLFSDAAIAASLNSTLRMLNIGGEKLNTTITKTFLQHAPDIRLTNGYGSTETTVCATLFEVTHDAHRFDDDVCNPIPIGNPIPNTKFFLLDEDLRQVDIGVRGEICISGMALARGYLDPSQTLYTKFITVADLEGPGTTTRIYRTGDLGRLASSSNGPVLEYVGRSDNQVKIRGQRLEPGEIEAVLRSEGEEIGEAAVVVTEDDKMIAYVVKKQDAVKETSNVEAKLAVNQDAWDAFHAQYDWEAIDPSQLGSDFTGWVSMYDGEPIPLPAMEDWLADTLNGIPVKPDDSILEIGCGTGMILFSMQSRCKEYIGIDMSGPSLGFVEAQVKRCGLQAKVKTLQGTADQLPSLLPTETMVDLIIINSVVQYFPSREYLENVLNHCVDRLRGGGRIFLGDLRSLGLDAHHDLARILHCDPAPDLTTGEIKERLDMWQNRHTEFKANPSFFFQLKERSAGRIAHVEILPKLMVAQNELSQFRYQVILHVGPQSPELFTPTKWVNYSTASDLKQILATSDDKTVAVRDIPNSMVWKQEVMLQLLRGDDPPSNASKLSKAAARSPRISEALSPSEIKSLGAQYKWYVDISWKLMGVDCTLSAVFSREAGTKPDFSCDELDSQPVNQPNSASFDTISRPDDQSLLVSLRALCRSRLPTYMVPDHIIIKDTLPLTSNGKVDRRLLAQRSTWSECVILEEQSAEACQPVDETQARVQRCVGDVLEVAFDKIPLNKDFIELGLHSFRAPKLLAALRSEFGLEVLPYATVYKYPSVTALALHLDHLIVSSEKKNSTATSQKRQAIYNQDALDKVLRARGLTTDDVEDVYETTWIQRFCLKDARPNIYMIHQLYTAHTSVDALLHALDIVLQRQTILRTTMFDDNRNQVVLRFSPNLAREIISIHKAEEVETIEEVLSAGHQVLSPPDNLVHFSVYNTTPITILYHVQHALLDAWSRTYLFTEIERAISGLNLPLPVPFRNFVDYMVTENARDDSAATWFATHFSGLDANPFPAVEGSREFTTSSVLGQNLEREELVSDLTLIAHTFGITGATLLKVAMALVMKHETKKKDVVFGQIYLCRNAPIDGITDICGPTFNYLIDSVDFRASESVLELLRRTQRVQHDMVDRSFVDFDAVQKIMDRDMAPYLRFSWSSRSEEEPACESVLQPGPLGLDSDLAIDWTTVVDNDRVKILVDYDPVLEARMEGYADEFFRAARWLAQNITAEGVDEAQVFEAPTST